MASDREILHHFLDLKSSYSSQRQSWESKWEQARAAYNADDNLHTVYQGRANIKIPLVDWKINGLNARINRVLFNVPSLGRFESFRTRSFEQESRMDIWNKYIFDYQLQKISFIPELKLFIKDKSILGTSIAKITQEFEIGEFSYFEDDTAEEIILKDDTRFKTIQLEEFYSDASKININESEACIHSTTVPLSELHKNSGLYQNLHLLVPTGTNISVEQEEYLSRISIKKSTKSMFKKSLKESKKTGFVPIDECYGRFDLDGDGIAEEVLVTIAHGSVVIRAEASPFRHKAYVRPFVVGRYIKIPNCLYGESKVIKSLPLLMELNASRAQALDAKTRAVAPMYYLSTAQGNINWDGVWTPDKVIQGISTSSPLQPIVNPDLGFVSINDSVLIQRDLDKIFNMSAAQEGGATRSQVPETFKGTAALIAQTDIPINDIIETTSEEMKVFFEMLYERNLRFKTVSDLAKVLPDDLLANAGITPLSTMADLELDIHTIRVLGNMELSNELAMQRGWESFAQFAQSVPQVSDQVDWMELSKKLLRAYGIKDDSEDIWHDPELVRQRSEAETIAREQARQQDMEEELAKDRSKQLSKAEAKIMEMGAEASIEQVTGQKVS
jgi:hypothetical protein